MKKLIFIIIFATFLGVIPTSYANDYYNYNDYLYYNDYNCGYGCGGSFYYSQPLYYYGGNGYRYNNYYDNVYNSRNYYDNNYYGYGCDYGCDQSSTSTVNYSNPSSYYNVNDYGYVNYNSDNYNHRNYSYSNDSYLYHSRVRY